VFQNSAKKERCNLRKKKIQPGREAEDKRRAGRQEKHPNNGISFLHKHICTYAGTKS